LKRKVEDSVQGVVTLDRDVHADEKNSISPRKLEISETIWAESIGRRDCGGAKKISCCTNEPNPIFGHWRDGVRPACGVTVAHQVIRFIWRRFAGLSGKRKSNV
jgi:hypothetical protein